MFRIFIAAILVVLTAIPPVFAQSSSLSKLQEGRGEQDDATKGPPIVFTTELSAYEESAVTDSPGVGHFECSLERATLKLSWKLTYSGLLSPVTSAAIHGPQTPGGEAGVLVDLGVNGLKSPMEGAVILNDGQLEYLLTGQVYVNVHTVKLPDGEIRGQLGRQRPKGPNS